MTPQVDWQCIEGVPDKKKMYQYRGCGLDDVYLWNGYTHERTPEGDGISIQDVDGLHRAIGTRLVTLKKELNGNELRFLRKEMNLTQTELSRFIGLSSQQVARWEKAHSAISGAADLLLRKLYLEHIGGRLTLRKLISGMDASDDVLDDEQVFVDREGKWVPIAACA
jgi:putative transcriptional regulator